MICPEVRELCVLRRKYGLSRDVVSSITNISVQNLYRYEKKGIVPIRPFREEIRVLVEAFKEIERGLIKPNEKQKQKLAKALGVNKDWLFPDKRNRDLKH